MPKRFIRKKEDFACQKCGFFIKGSGYTNHCPKCLWSRHVDINPGDRRSQCGGLMKPAAVEEKSGRYILIHKCQKCGAMKRNKINQTDDMDTIINITKGL